MKRAYKWVLLGVLIVVAALGLLGCDYARYRIVSWWPADEYPVYQVQAVTGGDAYNATAIGNERPAPPIGAMCKLISQDELDCGRRYAHLRIWWPPV